jgi:16S rRNA processing protein RimM
LKKSEPLSLNSPGGVERKAPADLHLELVRVARVARPQGIRGELRVALDHSESTILRSRESVFVEAASGPEEYQVLAVHPVGRGCLRMRLRGIDSRDAAETLRSAFIYVPAASLPDAAAGEFYSFRAIGCDVVTIDGERLGTVAEIFPTGANDVMVVRDRRREVLIPVIADVIRNLDFAARRITIDLLPGLLDSSQTSD